MKVYGNILETIGHTPLVELKNIEKKYGLKAKIIAKVEAFNPGGSVKDRVGKMLIEEGFRTGKINSETVIIEPTSGNTGIGLALTGSYYGLKVIIVMPDSMSIERINLMKAYGASIILTPGKEGMKGAINKANELAKEIPNSYIPSQFTNMANPKSHYLSTGPEIVEDLDGKVEYFVAGVGTGGTISGTGKFLKEKVPGIKIVAVEPDSSPVLSKGIAGPHKIQGIGAGFIPDTLDKSIYDEILTIGAEESYEAGRELAKEEGILVGISSGAALSAAIKIAQREENLEKTIVVLLPDRGERYLSTEMFCDK